MAYWVRNQLAGAFEALAAWAEERARRLKVCRECGRSLYYGNGCRGQYLAGCEPGE